MEGQCLPGLQLLAVMLQVRELRVRDSENVTILGEELLSKHRARLGAEERTGLHLHPSNQVTKNSVPGTELLTCIRACVLLGVERQVAGGRRIAPEIALGNLMPAPVEGERGGAAG